MKTRQQSFALRLALYILRHNGFPRPKKRQVLNFMRARNLLKFPEGELQKRWRDDHDSIWENDIAWKRKNLFDDGDILSPEIGHWELSPQGVAWVEKHAAKWSEASDDEIRKLLNELDYFTEETVAWILKVGRKSSLSLKLPPPT